MKGRIRSILWKKIPKSLPPEFGSREDGTACQQFWPQPHCLLSNQLGSDVCARATNQTGLVCLATGAVWRTECLPTAVCVTKPARRGRVSLCVVPPYATEASVCQMNARLAGKLAICLFFYVIHRMTPNESMPFFFLALAENIWYIFHLIFQHTVCMFLTIAVPFKRKKKKTGFPKV